MDGNCSAFPPVYIEDGLEKLLVIFTALDDCYKFEVIHHTTLNRRFFPHLLDLKNKIYWRRIIILER